MDFILGGLVALTVLWADSWQFRLRDFGLMMLINIILRVHSEAVRRDTIQALRKDAQNNGSTRTMFKSVNA